MKRSRKLAAGILAGVTLLISAPIRAYAQLCGDEPCQFTDFEQVVANIISKSLQILGVVLFAMLVIGGVQYLSSGGSPEGMQKAKGTLTYAVIGIALLVLAWFALLFIQQFTGVQVTIFKVSPD